MTEDAGSDKSPNKYVKDRDVQPQDKMRRDAFFRVAVYGPVPVQAIQEGMVERPPLPPRQRG